ncbi:glycoside hydrolase family 2 TIM barrel-domain containing protein [Pedococcus sp. P5_B7]
MDVRSWRRLDVPHDWRIEDLPGGYQGGGEKTADPSTMAFGQVRGPNETAPSRIGPFDAKADPVPDQEFTLPGVGHLVVPGGRAQGYTVGDIGWYRKEFTLQPGSTSEDCRVELRFDGVYGRTEVWINGVSLGHHRHGYTPFAYDLTPHLKRRATNVLAVRVDNRGKTSRWYTGSGIYRHTWLTTTGPVRIPLWGVKITTPDVGRTSTVRAEVKVTSAERNVNASLRLTVLDDRGRTVARKTVPSSRVPAADVQSYTADVKLRDASLWSPQRPTLYRLRTEVLVAGRVVDSTENTFGIRSIAWNGEEGFVLNGGPVKLLGGNIHHDHGPLGALALGRSEERTVETLVAAGFNAIRTSHNPPSPALLDACDRLGMLVWDEFTDVWDIPKQPDDFGNYFADDWQADLEAMVARDRNHPSVIVWSLGNEVADPNGFGTRMRDLVKSLDSTRPVTTGATGRATFDPDVIDIHYGNRTALFVGAPVPNDVFAAHQAAQGKALTQSESYPFSIYDDYRLAQDNPWMAGSFVWTAWDHIGESAIGATAFGSDVRSATTYALKSAGGQVGYPWFNNFSGDIDLIGQPKPQNHLRQVVYGHSELELLVARLAPEGTVQVPTWFGYYDEQPSWNWDVADQQPLTVHAYTRGDRVALYLNGAEIASRQVTEADKRVATFTVPYAAGELMAIAYRNGSVVSRKTLRTTGKAVGLRLTPDVENVTTNRDELVHVLVEVVDKSGRVVPDAVERVSVDVAGAGRLIGFGNGNPHNIDSFQQPRHHTWHGQALAIVRPGKSPGRLVIGGRASGLEPVTIALNVRPRRG